MKEKRKVSFIICLCIVLLALGALIAYSVYRPALPVATSGSNMKCASLDEYFALKTNINNLSEESEVNSYSRVDEQEVIMLYNGKNRVIEGSLKAIDKNYYTVERAYSINSIDTSLTAMGSGYYLKSDYECFYEQGVSYFKQNYFKKIDTRDYTTPLFCTVRGDVPLFEENMKKWVAGEKLEIYYVYQSILDSFDSSLYSFSQDHFDEENHKYYLKEELLAEVKNAIGLPYNITTYSYMIDLSNSSKPTVIFNASLQYVVEIDDEEYDVTTTIIVKRTYDNINGVNISVPDKIEQGA